MTNQSIKRILCEKGVTHLYHANTVATACTFIENNGLLSRGTIEDMGLYQTSQVSDEIDKEYDVFYDIFFDSVDIHQRSRNVNSYGPIVFVYSIDVLDILPDDCVRITRDNPIYWNSSMKDEDRYFSSDEELRLSYQCGRFCQHLVLRHQIEPLSFGYLEKIIIDDPAEEDNKFFDAAHYRLEYLLKKNYLDAPLEVRKCSSDCGCKNQYSLYSKKYIYYKYHFRNEENL